MTFGERLYDLRTRENISQETLAEVLDVSRQSISKWETDRAYPEMTRLICLSDYFHVSLDYLVRGREYHPTETPAVVPADRRGLKGIWTAWNTLCSNLNTSQVILFVILVLLIGVLCFCFGTAFGRLLKQLFLSLR